MSAYNEDAHWELSRRLERDEEREPRRYRVAPARMRQFRYWSGMMFRPVDNANRADGRDEQRAA